VIFPELEIEEYLRFIAPSTAPNWSCPAKRNLRCGPGYLEPCCC